MAAEAARTERSGGIDRGTDPRLRTMPDVGVRMTRREDAERFVEEIRGDDQELASYLQIEQRELEAGGLN